MAGAEENKQEQEGEDAITEVEQEEKNKEVPKSQPTSSSKASVLPTSPSNPFISWFYITLTITIVTIVVSILHPLFATNDSSSWFLTLPPALQDHYSSGTFIKTFVSPTHPPTKVFVVDHGPKSAEPILLVHGLGSSSFSFRNILQIIGSNGLRAVAVDLPGSGFSDLVVGEEDKSFVWGLNWAVNIWRDVKEKGLFWGFDQLVEMGYVPYEGDEEESSRVRVSGRTGDGAEMGRIVGEVVDSLRLSPVHLVAHDSSIGLVASWVSSNPKSVSSVTFIDSASGASAFPYWVLGVPIVREVVLGSKWVFGSLINICCSRKINMPAAEAYRVMLKRKGVRSAVVETGKGLNYSFEFGDWAGSDAVNGIPLQVLWSHMTSDPWIEEGKRIAASVPHAKFVPHLGGRWPQEGASEEIAGRLIEFVSSIPRSSRDVDEESPPEQKQHSINKADYGHDHHDQHHGHEYAGGYADAYGLGHAWGG